ncbi:MAG: hypothetical protein SFX18_10725 [Pirellulales bacterium]|nr:hypothetical protein [Pirellulales bacterium]
MSTEQHDPDLADQMRQQIRSLVREIEQLSRSDLAPAEFYEGYLTRVVSAMAAEGGAIWTLGEGNRLELVYQINLQVTQLANKREEQEQHGRLLRKVISSGQGMLAPPQSGNPEDAANPTDYLLVLGPLKNEQDTQGVLEIIHRPGVAPNVERGYLRFVLQMSDLGGDYLKTHRLRQFNSRQAMWSQLEQFTRLVHRDLQPRETAYTIANEGRRLIECDRVSVAVRRGGYYHIEAVSGQEGFDKRSNLIRLLQELTTTVCRSGEPLWYTGETADLAPQVEEAVEAYVDEAHTKLLAILPLARPKTELTLETTPNQLKQEEILGALIVEQIAVDAISTAMQRRVEVVRDHSALALANAVEHNSLFLMPLWRALGKTRAVVAWRNLPKTLTVLAAIVGILLALFLIPYPLKLEAKGTLEPAIKRDIFAAVSGIVAEVTPQAEQGQNVPQGALLAKMISPELDQQISAVIGEIESQEKFVQSINNILNSNTATDAEKTKARGEKASILAKIDSLHERLDLLNSEKQQLAVTSPLAGLMTTWQAHNKLINRPVERGQKLLTMADPTGPWELVLNVPDDKMGYILSARQKLKSEAGHAQDDLRVSFILATHPYSELEGTIKEIHTIAETQGEEGNMVQIKVAIDKAQLEQAGITDLRPGAGVTAKVLCGNTTLGFAWFHDLLSFIQIRFFFRYF